MSLRYFELNDDVGVAPPYIRSAKGLDVPNPRAGEPEPINEVGLPFLVPTVVDGDVIDTPQRAVIRPADTAEPRLNSRIIPGSRVIETGHPQVINSLIACGQYHEVDKPASEQPRRPRTPKEN